MLDEIMNQPLARIGMWILVIPNVFCTMELAPGWGLNLGIRPLLLYVIALSGGAIGGAMIGGRYFLPGMAGGIVASLGAIWLQTTYLSMVATSYNYILALLMILGALPGAGLAFGLGVLQYKLTEKPQDPAQP